EAAATGSLYGRQDAPNASLLLYVRQAGQWWPLVSIANGMLAFLTWAAAGAAPGRSIQTVAWIEEADAPYLFVPGDVTPVDGVTSIAPTAGTPGRWLIGSD